MVLEDTINGFESGELRDARLFYSTVKPLLAKIGYYHAYEHYFGVGKEFVGVRKDFDSFSRLVHKRYRLSDVKFVEVFLGVDLSKVRVMTGYDNMDALKNNVFSLYAIGSTSDLGCKLPPRERPNVRDIDKTKLAKLDLDEGFLTKIDSHYFFTLSALHKVVENSKPVIPPNFSYKC